MNWQTVKDEAGRTCVPLSVDHDGKGSPVQMNYRLAGSQIPLRVSYAVWESWRTRDADQLARERAGMADDEHREGAD